MGDVKLFSKFLVKYEIGRKLSFNSELTLLEVQHFSFFPAFLTNSALHYWTAWTTKNWI